MVAPFWSNTQVLWYRKSFVEKAGIDMEQPVTWDQIIDAAAKNDGKVAVQANKYEGYSVWINALISGAGGEIATDTEKGIDATLEVDSPGRRDGGGHHREALRLDGRTGRPVGLQRGHRRRHLRRAAGRVHGQLDLHLDQLRRDPARGEGRPRLRPLPADASRARSRGRRTAASASASAPTPTTSTRRCRRSSASPRPENQGVNAELTGNMPASAGRLRLPGPEGDLPAGPARALPGEPRRRGAAHRHAVLERHLRRHPEHLAPAGLASTTTPRRTRSSSSSDVLHGRSLL